MGGFRDIAFCVMSGTGKRGPIITMTSGTGPISGMEGMEGKIRRGTTSKRRVGKGRRNTYTHTQRRERQQISWITHKPSSVAPTAELLLDSVGGALFLVKLFSTSR